MDTTFNLSVIDENSLRIVLLQMKNKKGKLKCPQYLQQLIFKLNLTEIENIDERAKIFIQELFNRKLRSSTVRHYFSLLKPLLFRNCSIVPNARIFDSQIVPQERFPDEIHFNNMMLYLLRKCENLGTNAAKSNTKNDCYFAILFCYYTCLRISEICSLRVSHLKLLLTGVQTLSLQRKTGDTWNVVYHKSFQNFLHKWMLPIYQEKLSLLELSGIDEKLFSVSTRLLHYKIRHVYSIANGGIIPGKGFGLHVFRYYFATRLAEIERVDEAQNLLAHKQVRTTLKYVSTHKSILQKKLNSITNAESSIYAQLSRI